MHMSDFSDDLAFTVEGSSIKPTGTLKKVTGFVGFSPSNPEQQSGYYLPFKVTPKNPGDPVSIQVDQKPEVSSPEDNTFIVLLGKEASEAKRKVITVKSGADTFTMNLDGLTMQEDYVITLDIPDTVTVSQETQGSATLKGNEGAPSYTKVQFLIDVQSPEGSNPKIMATDSLSTEYNLAETKSWGPPEGFPITADYTATTPLKVTADKAGAYTTTVTLVDLAQGKAVIAKATKAMTAVDAD